MNAPYRIEVLAKHDRQTFRSGSEPLDRYFHRQVSQDVRRNLTACFVAVDTSTHILAGYYTLSATNIALSDIPEDQARRLPNYPHVPAVLLGRLAVDHHYQGRRLGNALLIDAVKRTLSLDISIYALLVDAKDEAAQRFYEHHGFVLLPGTERRLFLPAVTARKLL